MMEKKNRKDYGKPLMVMEKFVPNEYVAGCIKQSILLYEGGVLCFDDKDPYGFYNPGEDTNTGVWYAGDIRNAISFEVLETGRMTNENGALGYFYVGSSAFDYNTYPHEQDGTYSTYYNYSGSNFVPCYYAKLKVEMNQNDTREVTVYMRESGLNATPNVS